MSGVHQSPWDSIKEQLGKRLSAESFENWIARTRFAGVEGTTLHVIVPDDHTVSFLQEEYSQQIDSLARSLGLGIEHVVFRMEGSPAPGHAPWRMDLAPELE